MTVKLGKNDEKVLHMVSVLLKKDCYGVRIKEEIEARFGEQISRAGVYNSLIKLDKCGYITGEAGEPLAERGGRSRMYFRITGEGSAVLSDISEKAMKRAQMWGAGQPIADIRRDIGVWNSC